MALIQLGLFGRTSQELCHQMTGWILEPCSNPSVTPKFQCLALEDGQAPEWCEGDAVTLAGASWMPNFGESPNVVRESFLSQILEDNVPQKYYLSPKACEGILRRAERRGKELPPMLKAALMAQSTLPDGTHRTSEYLQAEESAQLCLEQTAAADGTQQDMSMTAEETAGGAIVNTLTGDHQSRVTDYTAIVAFTANDYGADVGAVSPTLRAGGHDKSHMNGGVVPAICIAGNHIDRQQGGGNGVGAQEELAYTHTSADRHAVAVFMAGQGAKSGGITYSEDVSPTIKGAGSGTNQVPTVAMLASGKQIAGTLNASQGEKLFLGNQEAFSGDYHVVTHPDKVANCLKAKANLSFRDDSDNIVATVDCRNLNENGDISGTLQAKATGGYSLNYTNPVRNGQTVRRLTPIECERLQGFPDDWTRYGHDGKEISDSARYKAIGNSLALPCVEYLIAGIREAITCKAQ